MEQGHLERRIDVRITSILLWKDEGLQKNGAAQYWIEVTLENPPDSGADYMLVTGDHVRGIRTTGNKWKISFPSYESAQESFSYLRDYYKLDSAHARENF